MFDKKEHDRQYYLRTRDARLLQSKKYREALRNTSIEEITVEAFQKYLWTKAKSRAKQAQITFTIQPEDIEYTTVCPILGVPLSLTSFGKKQRNPHVPSLDRINNKKGYVKGNIKVISHLANRKKGDLTLHDIQRLMEYVSNHNEAFEES